MAFWIFKFLKLSDLESFSIQTYKNVCVNIAYIYLQYVNTNEIPPDSLWGMWSSCEKSYVVDLAQFVLQCTK